MFYRLKLDGAKAEVLKNTVIELGSMLETDSRFQPLGHLMETPPLPITWLFNLELEHNSTVDMALAS